MNKRTCTCCKIEKPISEFYKLTNGYLMGECKLCTIERVNVYRKNHKEQVTVARKKYVNLDKEKWKKYARNYQRENKERINESVCIKYFFKKLKEEFQIDFGKYSIKNKSTVTLIKFHKELKEMYKKERQKRRLAMT